MDWSHPSRVRGLKYPYSVGFPVKPVVAPFTGAWIEILKQALLFLMQWKVAPFTGAWIEILILALQ